MAPSLGGVSEGLEEGRAVWGGGGLEVVSRPRGEGALDYPTGHRKAVSNFKQEGTPFL